MVKVSTTGIEVSSKTDLRFPDTGQQGHERWIIQFVFFTFFWKMNTDFILVRYLGEDMFMSYTSPTMLGIAAVLLLLFLRIRLNKGLKYVRWIASCTFAVYLIHTQPLVFSNLIVNKFKWIAAYDFYMIPGIILGIAAGIFIVCILIDSVRKGIVVSILKIFQWDTYLGKGSDQHKQQI